MADREENGAMRIDPALVRELAELLTENQLTEIEVEDGDRTVRRAATVRVSEPAVSGGVESCSVP